MRSYTLENLRVEDLSKVKPIGEAFTKSVNYPGGFHWETFSNIWTLMLKANIGQINVVTDGEEVVGTMGTLFTADPFSGWMTALEQFWYVIPECRNSCAGGLLFHAFEREAIFRKCKKRVMVTLEGEFSDTLCAFYFKKGYRLAEKSFVKIIS